LIFLCIFGYLDIIIKKLHFGGSNDFQSIE